MKPISIGVVYIMQRKLDGAGIPQTPPLKWASLAVLGSVFILIALCQALVLYFVKRSNKISHN